MDRKPYIRVAPNVHPGKACIKGTRIPVAVILDHLAVGLGENEIIQISEICLKEAQRNFGL
jgi:uncharacterized protein (DUF433 family)